MRHDEPARTPIPSACYPPTPALKLPVPGHEHRSHRRQKDVSSSDNFMLPPYSPSRIVLSPHSSSRWGCDKLPRILPRTGCSSSSALSPNRHCHALEPAVSETSTYRITPRPGRALTNQQSHAIRQPLEDSSVSQLRTLRSAECTFLPRPP